MISSNNTLTWSEAINAYTIYGHDIDSYAFRRYPNLTDNQRVHQSLIPDLSDEVFSETCRCKKCGEILKKADESLNGLVVSSRKYDIGTTYDGILVVSSRFKTTYVACELSGLTFRQLPDDSEFTAIYASTSVEFDAICRKTRFIKQCPDCNCYESVVGATPALIRNSNSASKSLDLRRSRKITYQSRATPVYLKHGVTIGEREFVRTDLEFGSGDEKCPVILCGEVAADAFSAAKLRSLDMELAKYRPSGAGVTNVRQTRSYTGAGMLAAATDAKWTGGVWQPVVVSTHMYDLGDRKTGIMHGTGTVDGYAYDANSRLTVETIDGTAKTYAYDTTDQLTNDNGSALMYDLNGNRTVAGYTTGANNRMTNDGTWAYTYDAEGNVVKRSKGAAAETWVYGYDLNNRLVTAVDSA